ncbi:MAG TPA: ubiquinone/menaquinone biosynthesis methyltransferase [Terriglobales bacterium]|nr:ubiquinone/menaquinone biosynthesis methyltransferase [Terriglobales bacterium]
MPNLANSRDRRVQNMFDRIAWRYDLLNHIISFRLDKHWRRKAIDALLREGNEVLLDLGTGTGDLTFAAAKRLKPEGQVVGLDFSLQMLSLAKKKRDRLALGGKSHFVQASALAPPFRDGAFDGIMTAFVLRNVSDLRTFFEQAYRVLKPRGRLVSLDMFPPPGGLFSSLYGIYFHRFMPLLGGLLAHDSPAYHYLSDSVRNFDPPNAITRLIEGCGFAPVTMKTFLRGAVCLHIADKPH